MRWKILGIFLFMFLLISLTSAELLTIDNKVVYEKPNLLKVEIVNTLDLDLFGEPDRVLGTVELKSHNSINEVKKVGYGKDEVVMYYDFQGWELYENGLGNIYFTDMRTGESIDKIYSFVVWTNLSRVEDIYEYDLDKNGRPITPGHKVGERTVYYMDWVDYNSRDIPYTKDEIVRIGLKTYVDKDDYIDGVWTIAGKRITEHASWQSGWETDLVLVYEFEGSSGTSFYDNITGYGGADDGSIVNAQWSIGAVGLGLYYDGTGDYCTIPDDKWEFTGDRTHCVWANSPPNASYPILMMDWNGNGLYYDYNNAYIRWLTSIGNIVGNTNVSDGQWHQHCVTTTTGNTTIWLDGKLDATTTNYLRKSTGGTTAKLGGDGAATSMEGWMDEIFIWNRSLSATEINDFYEFQLAGGAYQKDSPSTDTNQVNWTTIPGNDSIGYGVTWSGVQFEAVDKYNNVSYSVNDTDKFIIDGSGWLNTTYNLAAGIYNVMVNASDNGTTYNLSAYELTVTQDTSNCQVLFSHSSPLSNATAFNVYTDCTSGFQLYRNGTIVGNNSIQYPLNAGYYNYSVFRNDTANYTNVFDDEWFNLTEAAGNKQITVSLNSIANDTTWDNGTIPFSTTTIKSGDITLANTTLYIWFENGSIASTNTTSISGFSNTTVWTQEVPYRVDDDFTWNVLSYSNESYNWSVDNRTYRIENYPNVTLRNPANLYNFTTSTYWFETIVDKIQDPYLVNATSYIWFSNGTLFTTSYRSLGVFATLFNTTGTALENNTYYYNTEAFSKNWVDTTKTFSSWATENKSFVIPDLTAPIINVTLPTNSSILTNYVETNLTSVTFNWTVSDSYLDSCWYDFNNGTKVEVTCNTNQSLQVNFSTYLIDFYANDTSNNTNVVTRTPRYAFKVYGINKTFSNQTTEGSLETFELWIQEGKGYDVQAVVLHYDGTSDISSLSTVGGLTKATSELLIPGVSADTNNTLYFTIYLNDSSSFNTTSANQTVLGLSIDDCSSQPYPLIYFNLKDEEARTPILGTIETNFEIINSLDFQQIINLSQEFDNVSYLEICTSTPLNTTDLLLNAEIRYSADNYSAEFFHLQKQDLGNYPQNISLFDLLTEDTTRFKILYRSEDLVGVEGAIVQLQRKYISDGIYETVEAPLTSSESTAILHIDTNSQKYQAVVTKDGEVLGFFSNLVFVCQSELTGECTLDLLDSLVPPNLVNLNTVRDFAYYLNTSDDDKTVKVTYVIPSGTISSVNVVAEQTGIVDTTVICNQTILSSSGAVTCTYTESIEDSQLTLQVFKSGESVVYKEYVVKENLEDDWAGNNYFLVVILLLSLAFMAFASPEWVVGISVLVIVIAGGTWLIRGMDFVSGIGATVWLFVAAAILISKMSKQEDR